MIHFPYAEETIKSVIRGFERRGFVLYNVYLCHTRQSMTTSLSSTYNISKYGLLLGKLKFQFGYHNGCLNCAFMCEDNDKNEIHRKRAHLKRPSGKRFGTLASKKLLEYCQKTVFQTQIKHVMSC